MTFAIIISISIAFFTGMGILFLAALTGEQNYKRHTSPNADEGREPRPFEYQRANILALKSQ